MRRFLLIFTLALAALGVSAQTPAPATTAAAASPAAPAAPANAAPGVKSANIFQIAPGADADPKYKDQSNAERAQVQPGNNAPMWRAVGQGVTGYTSYPKSQAPEAGNLIQPFVQYPGSRLSSAGESWRQVRNNLIIPYGGALLLISLGAVALFYMSKGTMEPAARSNVLHRLSGRPIGPTPLLFAHWPYRVWSWPMANTFCCPSLGARSLAG